MLISIFPEVKALPSKSEKGKEARFASKPHHPMTVDIKSEDDLISAITENAWSPNIYNGYRLQANFIQTDFMTLDIDDGMTIEESESIVEGLGIASLCLPSTSHTEEAHRFRLVFPLAKTITDDGEFEATMKYLAEIFPADPSCVNDKSRFYFGCRLDAGYWSEGALLVPRHSAKKPSVMSTIVSSTKTMVSVGEELEEHVLALYGSKQDEIPEQVSYFLENAHTGLTGEWHNAANSFLFTLGLQGIDFDKIEEVFTAVSPEDLDQHDEYLLGRATEEGYKARLDNKAE